MLFSMCLIRKKEYKMYSIVPLFCHIAKEIKVKMLKRKLNGGFKCGTIFL